MVNSAKLALSTALFASLSCCGTIAFAGSNGSHNDSARHRTHGHSKPHSSQQVQSKKSVGKVQVFPSVNASESLIREGTKKLGSEQSKPIGNHQK